MGPLWRSSGAMRDTPSAQIVSTVNSNATKVNANTANCGANGKSPFKNCGKNAAKNSSALGLLAPTKKPRQ